MKRWIVRGSLTLGLALAAFVADRFTNFGLPFGYYGELNRMSAALESIPGISIDKVGYNADLTLEELTFWIKNERDFHRQIHFGQNDPIRDLWGKDLEAALAERLSL